MATVTAVDVGSGVCARVGSDAEGSKSARARLRGRRLGGKRISREQKRAMTLALNEKRARQAMEALVMSMEAVDEGEDLEAMERDLENRGRDLLRAALQRKAQRKADATPPVCPKCGAALKAATGRETQVLSRFGPIRISRDYGYCPKCKEWRTPGDEALGVDGPNTAPMAESLQLLGTVVPPGQAETMSEKLLGMAIDDARICRELKRAGLVALEERRRADEKALDTEGRWKVTQEIAGELPKDFVMIILADAFMTRERDEWGRTKQLRAQGLKPERWHETKTGTVFLLGDRAQSGGRSNRPVILHRSFLATRAPAFEFGQMLYAQAVRQGLLVAKEVYFIADGGVWLWRLHKDRFAEAIGTLDYYHAGQHLWVVARARYGEGDQAKKWVEPLQHQLRHGGEAGVLKSLEQLTQIVENIEPEKRDENDLTVLREWEYFQSHREHMNYAAKADRGIPIGSGCIESTCKQYQVRVKRCGQFWTTESLEGLLCLYSRYLQACLN